MSDPVFRLPMTLSTAVDLLDLRMVAYRGCMIRESSFTVANVDDWLHGTEGDVAAVDDVLNHVHLEDYWADPLDEEDLVELGELGARAAEIWRDIARVRYPDRRFVVDCYSDDNNPTLTIYQAF